METKRICSSCHKTLPPDVPLGLCPECLLKAGFNTGTEPGLPGNPKGFVPPTVEELQGQFQGLEVIQFIGQGGMGAVYQARQPALDRLVALKILPPGAADDPGFAERFNREARTLARLNHPHIVAIYDFGHANGRPYLVMEYVDGPNLRQVQQTARLTPEQALAVVPQICDALEFAHTEGVVHRDIKPENILLDKKGRVKITDFGIAKIVGIPGASTALTGAKDLLGTPHYMAPEQVERPQEVDHRADIYSLGVVFYELLTGELPIGRFQPPSRKVHVDVRLDEVVLHTLEKEPIRRYQHASEVKADVQTITAGPPPAGERTPYDHAGILRQVRNPAIGLVATGVLNWILIPLATLIILWVIPADWRFHGSPAGLHFSNTALRIASVVSLALCSLTIFGALKMKHLEAYWLAIASSVLAMLVTPGNIIGLPIGLWSLAVLTRREVREAFKNPASLRVAPGPPLVFAPASGPAPDRFWRYFAIAIVLGLVMLLLIPVGAIVASIAAPAFRRARLQAQTTAQKAQYSPNLFGAVLTRTLNDLDENRGQEALNLTTGALLSLPAGFGSFSQESREAWLNTNHVNLLVDHAQGRWALLTRGLTFRDLEESRWTAPDDSELGGAWPESTILEKKERNGVTLYLLPPAPRPPLTFAFATSTGTVGLLQLLDLAPGSVKLRYRLFQPPNAGGGGIAITHTPANPASPERSFVRIVADPNALTFQGQSVADWESLDNLLAGVTNRKNTVLELAVTSDGVTVAQQNQWVQLTAALARKHGFAYSSFVGIHPLSSKGGATPVPAKSPTVRMVTRHGIIPRLTFQPAVTKLVSGEGDARKRFIDLDTGHQFAASEFFDAKAEPSPEETRKWWKENSIDAMGDTKPEISGLLGFDLVAVPVPMHEWDMQPGRLDYYLANATPGTPAILSAKGDLPATYVIQTREGGRGLLQITGFSGFQPGNRSVEIRYKLLQNPQSSSPNK